MANTVNEITLLGNIVFDVEQKQTPTGISVCNNRIAVKRKYPKDGEADVDFFNFTAYKHIAEYLARYFKKGDRILIKGELQTNNYTDKDGNKRYDVRVIVYDVVSFRPIEENKAQTANTYDAPQYAKNNSPTFDQLRGDDDLPF